MDDTGIQRQLGELAGWNYTDGMIRKTYTFKNFVEAMAWVVHVAFLAEAHGHHPDIDIRYNRVSLALVTHDAGNTVTQKDLDLAQAIEQIGG
jgi:4a-hydroxytetrahydrobiopterin dehydratase